MARMTRLSNRWKLLHWGTRKRSPEKTVSAGKHGRKLRKFNFRLRIPSPQQQFYIGNGKFLDR